jgi:hypothetical protein
MTLEKIPKSPLPVVHAAEQAAAMVGANPHYVTDAKKIEQDAPEILDQVKQGKLSIPQAKTVAPSLTDRLLAPPALGRGLLSPRPRRKTAPILPSAHSTLARASSPA